MAQNYLYSDFISSLNQRVVRELESIEAHNNFELGDEFEFAICKILRRFLPSKYGICRGFVVNKQGDKAGDDIIIYDQERFPTLRLLDRDDYSRLENIPIEAVYAYIEAKHTFNLNPDANRCVLQDGIRKSMKVKELLHGRTQMNLGQSDPYINVEMAFDDVGLFPSYRNPPFTVVLARYVAIQNRRLENGVEIDNALKINPIDNSINAPDLIIAGRHNYVSSGLDGADGNVSSSLFYQTDRNFNMYSEVVNDLGFGVFLSRLAFALDWIRLGKMPWSDIINDASK